MTAIVLELALSQLIFLTLGTISLNGMLKANGDITSSLYFQFLEKNWTWLYLLPFAWIGYTLFSYQINRGPFTPTVARVVGIVLSGICLVFFGSVLFFPSP